MEATNSKGTTGTESGYVSATKAAQYLGVHVQTVYAMLRRGELGGRKVAHKWRVSGNALQAILPQGA